MSLVIWVSRCRSPAGYLAVTLPEEGEFVLEDYSSVETPVGSGDLGKAGKGLSSLVRRQAYS